ncbi:hypothetical protein [Microbacterium rhizomatis]|nr:hypothetical protein [Microbacterium rhizomatis]
MAGFGGGTTAGGAGLLATVGCTDAAALAEVAGFLGADCFVGTAGFLGTAGFFAGAFALGALREGTAGFAAPVFFALDAAGAPVRGVDDFGADPEGGIGWEGMSVRLQTFGTRRASDVGW